MTPLSVFILATKTDRAQRAELMKLIGDTMGKACSLTDVEWPTDKSLPWISSTVPYAVVIPVTREALTKEKGWAQALTSHQVDTSRTIALFLSGLDHKSVPGFEFRQSAIIAVRTIADGSREIMTHVETMARETERSGQPERGGVDTRQLLGRQREIAEAIAMAASPTKSIAIVGLGGQGKTSFASILVKELVPMYDAVSWISLRTGPTLDWVAQQLAHQVGAEISVADATAETATGNIIRMLSARQVLMVLDNAETVFTSKAGSGLAENSQDLSSHYEYLFRSVAEVRLESLLLITSRELPNAYRLFPDTLRVMRLPGLDDSAIAQLMKSSGVILGEDLLTRIQSRFLGNPLAVKLFCGLYLDRGSSIVTDLLASDSPVVDDISALMDEHVSRLPQGERFLLAKIAWEGGAVKAADLTDLAWPIDPATIRSHLHHLSRALLVDSDATHVSISHPLLREHLIEEVKREVRIALLLPGEPQVLAPILSTILLVNPHTDDYVQTQQIRAVESLVGDVKRQLGTKHKIRGRILGLIDLARRSRDVGYTVANLVEVARRVGTDLHGADFSSLPLDRVDFRDIDVRDSDCSNSAFRSCVFGDNFGPVTAVARVETSQELLAAGTFEGFVRLWTAEGDLHSAVKCADDWISAITPVTANGSSYFAAVDGSIGRIDWATLSPEKLAKVDAQVRGLTIAGRHLVAACADGTVRLMDTESRSVMKVHVTDFRLKVVRHVPGASQPTVLLGGDSGELLFYDIGKEVVTARVLNGQAWVRDVLFDCAGLALYTADDDGRVRAWGRNGAGEFELKAEASHSHRVWCLAVDEASSRLFSAGNDSVIRVWETSSLKQLDLYEGHGSWIRSMTLLQAGRVLASGGEDQTLRFWRTDDGHCFRRRTGYARRVFAIGFGSDDVLVCGTGDHKVVKFDLSSDKGRSSYFDGHRDQVFAIAVEIRSNRVASASDDGEVRVCDLSSGDTVFAERLHTGWIGSVAFSPSGVRLVSGADDRTIVVLEAVHFTPVGRKRTHEGRISTIVFANEDTVVCSSEDGTVRVLELPSLVEHLSFQIGAGPLYSVSLVGHTGAAIAAGVGGRVWRLQLVEGARPEVIAELSVNSIWSIDVSPDGRTAALGTDDGSLVLLDTESKETTTIGRAHQRQIWSVRWSPSGRMVATASEDGQVALWKADGGLIMRLAPPLLYQGMRIGGAEGLSPVERRHLLSMGAVQ